MNESNQEIQVKNPNNNQFHEITKRSREFVILKHQANKPQTTEYFETIHQLLLHGY